MFFLFMPLFWDRKDSMVQVWARFYYFPLKLLYTQWLFRRMDFFSYTLVIPSDHFYQNRNVFYIFKEESRPKYQLLLKDSLLWKNNKACTKYCKSLYIIHNQQFLKSGKKTGHLIPTKHADTVCDEALWWTLKPFLWNKYEW